MFESGAHRVARNRLFNLTPEQMSNHDQVFDYIIVGTPFEDVELHVIYKILNTRHSFDVFYNWIHETMYIVGPMHGYLQEMSRKSMIYVNDQK